LAASIEASVAQVDPARTVCLSELSAESLFAAAVRKAIVAVEARGDILRRFLQFGPREDTEATPDTGTGQHLSDQETEVAVTVLYSHAVNAFKGELAEVLSLGTASRILSDLSSRGVVPTSTRLYVGDAAVPVSSRGRAKGADLHYLATDTSPAVLAGVGEVKSFPTTPARLAKQLSSHTSRALQQLEYRESPTSPTFRVAPTARTTGVFRVSACPSRWKLSREYRFEESEGRSFLIQAPLPSIPDDCVTEIGEHRHIELGWSHEALAAEAYGLTYWYMEQLGTDLFAEHASPWPEMNPEESGVNAAKQSLYYAILRSTNRQAEQRAIALYNAYGFGYALGSNYKDRKGHRRMLWPEDLRELLGGRSVGRECWIH